MRWHFDLLGWLHLLAGAFTLLAAASLVILALGTRLAIADVGATGQSATAAIWVLALFAVVFGLTGGALTVIGRALLNRRPFARPAALLLAIPSLLAVPFGTALAIYTCWALLNDDARRAFGRRIRGADDAVAGDEP
jgi:hypothetical protein